MFQSSVPFIHPGAVQRVITGSPPVRSMRSIRSSRLAETYVAYAKTSPWGRHGWIVGRTRGEANPPVTLGDRGDLGKDAGVHSDLFNTRYAATAATQPGMTLQNSKSIKYAVNGECYARQGAMIAFRGNLQFERKGQGVGNYLKRRVTGEGLTLMA